jgi:hypothetical protein
MMVVLPTAGSELPLISYIDCERVNNKRAVPPLRPADDADDSEHLLTGDPPEAATPINFLDDLPWRSIYVRLIGCSTHHMQLGETSKGQSHSLCYHRYCSSPSTSGKLENT